MTLRKRRLQVNVLHTTPVVFWFRGYGVLMMILNSLHVLTVSPKHLPKSKKRSVDSPPNVLEVNHKRKQQYPPSAQSSIHEHSTNEHLQSKQSLDIAYCLTKLQEIDGHISPGWIGYNTPLNSTTIFPLAKLG